MRSKLYKQRHAIWQQGINISFLLPIFILLTSVISVLIISTQQVIAATSSTLNFQGRLLTNTGGLVPDGSYNIEFKIYDDPTAGTNFWTENRTGGSAVTVKNGYFSVYLGEVTPFGASIPWDQELYMTMNVNADGEMTPRFKLTAVPYAFRAGAVTDSAGNAFTGDDLIQKSPSTIQGVNSALAAIRLNQAGAGGLLQLQGDGTDVFTVSKTGAATLGAGITVGNSTNTTAGTIRWSGTDLEVYDGAAWVSLTSGSGGGGGTLAFDAFYAYDAVGDISLDAGWTDITLDTEVKEDAPYTHAADSAEVTINEDGWYEVTYNVGLYTSDTNNNRGTADAKLQENTGSGFVDIPGSEGTAYLRGNGGEGNVSVTLLRQFSIGDIIKIQAQRSLGTNTSLTLPNSAGLTVKKFIDAGSGGGGGTSFEQNGNAFGTTAILGTTDSNGLSIITNNSTALSFTSAGLATFTNGLTVSSGGLNLTGDISATSGLTISSGGSGDLILDSASGVLVLSDSTLQRSASGTTVIDLLDAGAGTTLSLLNSDGTQVANLLVEGGITAANFTGSGAGLTSLDAGNISTGTISDGLLTSNVALLNGSQTFTGLPTFSEGLILGNSTSTTSGAIRWSGTDFEGYDGIQWVSLTSGGGGGGGSSPALTTVIKSSDQSVTNSVVFQNDTDLKFPVGANENWVFRFVVQANVNTAPDIKFAVTGPAGATCDVSLLDTEGAVSVGNVACGVSTTVIVGANAVDTFEIVGSIRNGATPGDVTLQWGQNTATVNTLTVYSGSSLTASIGGGGLQFLQGGNDFGATAVLGTKGNNNLNLIVNNATALSLNTSNQAVFTSDIIANGSTTLGDNIADGLTIVSGSVTTTNGLNFDSDTFVIDSTNNRIGIGTNLTTNLLTINNANTADAAAQLLLATGATTNKGLVIQGAASQSANLFEVQNSTGNTLAGFNANGGLVLGLSTLSSTATVSRNISLPDASGTICLSSSTLCGYIQFASGSFQTDATTSDTIAINKTGATGNLLALQKNGGAVFTVSNTGALQIQNSSSTALDIRNTGGTSYFSVDTSTGIVRVGPATADAVGVLFVLDTKNTTGDPTGTNGGIYYNSSLGKFRCYEAGEWKDCIGTRQIRSFVDNTTDAVVDANTTNYWDTAAENNNIHPNLTPSSTAKSVLGTVSVQISSGSAQDRTVVTRVERGIGSVPTCGSGTVVGFYASTFTTNTGDIITSTISFLDTPATTSQVFYTLCSDANTSSATGMSVDKIRITLEEANNSN